MRTTALIALLPFLATLVTSRPHHPGHDHSAHRAHHTRKSLSFGPKHSHASFEFVDEPVSVRGMGLPVDVKEVARNFIGFRVGGQEGETFYIRDDTYTDTRTGITHIYAKQLLNGLEVSDGDINLNIDRDGKVLSWGNSFHPGQVPNGLTESRSGETEKVCAMLKQTMNAHREELRRHRGEDTAGAWGMVKAAAQVMLGVSSEPAPPVDEHEVAKVHKNMRPIWHHMHAMCSDRVEAHEAAFGDRTFLSPIDALITLLPRVSPVRHSMQPDLSATDFSTTLHHSLQPKPAQAEPPTQMISGVGLAKAGVMNDVPARLMYTQISEGEPRMAWKLEVELKDSWYEAYVDAKSGELLRIVDWTSDYSWDTPDRKAHDESKGGHKQKPLPSPPVQHEPYTYQVFPWGINDPSTGNLSIVHKPWDTTASPLGWHTFPTVANPWSSHLKGMNITGNMTTFATTIGNNIIAHEDWEGQNNYLTNYRPVNDSMVFVYDYGEVEGLAPKEYVDFVTTQLFYTSNMYHDLTYRLGFDELAGNFQAHNFGLGGKGGDPVIANAQDGSGYNNANFATPPDGTSGRMRMYIWDTATPFRDGDLEAGIVIHELSHGLSTRLTGGPANSGCLAYGEAGGMGEGWGDALATLIRQVEEHKVFKNGTDLFSMGSWAANRNGGIRNFQYSTNATVNPSTYKTLDKPGYWGVHAIGEVWAEFLFVMSQRLIEKYGFSTTLFPPTNTTEPNDYYTKTTEESVDSLGRPIPLIPKHGNTLAIQLIISAMKIQPCRPSFFDARDAIIQADQITTGGENTCLIWKAFAERGLGTDANVVGQTPWGGGIRTDGHHVPTKVCKGSKD